MIWVTVMWLGFSESKAKINDPEGNLGLNPPLCAEMAAEGAP